MEEDPELFVFRVLLDQGEQLGFSKFLFAHIEEDFGSL
jgi:hypothetical protein